MVAIFLALIAYTPQSLAVVTATTTVTGWLVPDGTHFNNGIVAFIYPIAGVTLFVIMARVLDLEGRTVATLALAGLVVGSVLGMLTLGNSTAGQAIPFALPVIAAVDFILFLWQGGG